MSELSDLHVPRYGPAPDQPAPAQQPLVLAVRPRQGWSAASPARRALAGVCVALLTLMLLGVAAEMWLQAPYLDYSQATAEGFVADDRPAASVIAALALLYSLVLLVVGPPAFCAAARILRPYPVAVGPERRIRHAMAGTATAYGSAVLLSVTVGMSWLADPLGWLFIVAATLLGVLSLLQGVVALLVRLLKHATR